MARESSEGASAGRSVALVLASILSLTLSVTYATLCFVPRAAFVQNADTYDAFRYDWMATRASSWPLDRILADDVPLKSAGYFRFLAAFYHYWGPDAVAGCVVNWLLWLAAGMLLLPVAAEGHVQEGRVRAVFLGAWLLLPEAIDWTGTTSKEALCALAVAAGLRLARFARLASWLALVPALIAAAVLALAAAEIRAAVLPLVLAPLAVSIESRLGRRRRRVPWSLVAAVAVIAVGFVRGAGEMDNTGAEFARETWGQGFSSHSVLLRLGSSNRWLDLLAVPLRGLAHLVVPLNTPPTALPLAVVSSPSLLQWASAALYVVLAAAVFLRVREGVRWRKRLPPVEVTLAATCVVALVLLGLIGIIHERYRSILVPAFLPLGVRHAVDEVRKHGWQRIAVTLGVGGGLAAVAYLALKFLI